MDLLLVLLWHELVAWWEEVLEQTEFAQSVEVEGGLLVLFSNLKHLLLDHEAVHPIATILIRLSAFILYDSNVGCSG